MRLQKDREYEVGMTGDGSAGEWNGGGGSKQPSPLCEVGVSLCIHFSNALHTVGWVKPTNPL